MLVAYNEDMKTGKGFSLMELLVVMGIIVLLTGVGVVNYSQTNRKARDAKRKADIESIRSALELYRTDQGSYPALTTNGSTCITQTEISGGGVIYLNSMPVDTKNDGATYCYKYQRPTATTYTLSARFEETDTDVSYSNP